MKRGEILVCRGVKFEYISSKCHLPCEFHSECRFRCRRHRRHCHEWRVGFSHHFFFILIWKYCYIGNHNFANKSIISIRACVRSSVRFLPADCRFIGISIWFFVGIPPSILHWFSVFFFFFLPPQTLLNSFYLTNYSCLLPSFQLLVCFINFLSKCAAIRWFLGQFWFKKV